MSAGVDIRSIFQRLAHKNDLSLRIQTVDLSGKFNAGFRRISKLNIKNNNIVGTVS